MSSEVIVSKALLETALKILPEGNGAQLIYMALKESRILPINDNKNKEDIERMEWLEQRVAEGNCWFWDYAGELRWCQDANIRYDKNADRSARVAIDNARRREKDNGSEGF